MNALSIIQATVEPQERITSGLKVFNRTLMQLKPHYATNVDVDYRTSANYGQIIVYNASDVGTPGKHMVRLEIHGDDNAPPKDALAYFHVFSQPIQGYYHGKPYSSQMGQARNLCTAGEALHFSKLLAAIKQVLG